MDGHNDEDMICLITNLTQNKVHARVGECDVKALIDTGASITVASSRFLSKTSYRETTLDPPRHRRIKGVSGHMLEVLGVLEIPIELGQNSFKQEVHVIKDLHHSLIIGLDFIMANKLHLDFETNTLHAKTNTDIPLIHPIEVNAGLARADKQFTIPKRSETLIKVQLSRCKDGQSVYLNPLPSLTLSQQLIAAKCLVTVHKRRAVIKVLNPTYSDVIVRDRQVLATIEEIYPDQVIPFSNSHDEESVEVNAIKPDSESSNENKLEFDLSESDLTEEQKHALSSFLYEYTDIFSSDLSQLGKTSLYKHKIETLPGAKPVRKQFYRTSPETSKEIRKHVDEMLEHGIVQPSNSEWHSPVVLVKKKNGQSRFACDYRALNKITVPMSFPLPHLETVFDSIGDAKAQYFTHVDFKSAFWQVEMSPCSRHKAAFITQDGVFEWKRMPFGLMNAPISFQTLMSGVLRELSFKSVLVYIDDVLIFSPDFDSHLRDLSLVFNKLRQAGLTLEPSKCHFAVKQLKFLGHVISKHGVEVDAEKTKIVSEFPVPKKQKQVRSFMGMANYYRRFIHNFAKISTPLYALLKKDTPFKWTEACQKSFDKLKAALLSAPILSYPDPVKHFVLTCDASDSAIGFYLSQVSTDNQEHVIAYGGKALSKEEKNYNTSEKELLAVLKGVEAYRPYLVGRKFTIYTDHRALVWLKSAKHTGRLERWALKLQEYDYDIVHRPGKSNYVADALSRIPYSDDEAEDGSESKGQPEVSTSHTPVLPVSDTHQPEGVQVNLYYSPDDTEIVALGS